MEDLKKENILGVEVTNAHFGEVLEFITRSLEEKQKPYYIVTPNPEIIVWASKHEAFRSILNQARITLPDGVGVTFAAQILGMPLQERITGADLMEQLCNEVSKKPITVGFLGGRDGVAEKTAERLMEKYPGLKVAFVAEEWGEEGFDLARKYSVASSEYLVSSKKKKIPDTKYQILNTHAIDILFVAFGFPKQEEWMAGHVGKIPVRVMMGVGGAFDYLSGAVPRAPFMVRAIGFEWLYRLVRQPWRLKRQLSLLEYLLQVSIAFLTGSSKG